MQTPTLDILVEEWESMNERGAMDAVGIGESELSKLVPVVEQHELGATAKAVLIYIRGMLQRTKNQFNEAVNEASVLEEWKRGLPASSSVSRAVPLSAAISEHLPTDKPRTIIDLGAGRAHAARMFLEPEMLNMPFFSENRPEKHWLDRVAWPADRMPNISRVLAVDNRSVDFAESAQVYIGDPRKMAVMEALEEKGDHDGRLVEIRSDIRNLEVEGIKQKIGEGEAAPVIFLNNILYAVSAEVRTEIEAAVNKLAEELEATILQMESRKVLSDEEPEITLPSRDGPLGLPAFVRIGTNLSAMKVVAKLDGNTGKPFILVKQDGSEVFINKDGEEQVLNAA